MSTDIDLETTISCQADLLRLLRGQLAAALAELATAREVIDRDTVLIRDQAAEIAVLRVAAVERDLAPAKPAPGPVPLGTRPHASDCAVHNEPAFPRGRCDCGALHNPFREFGGDRRRIGG